MNQRSAFTAIEALAATMLASMMLVAVLGILASLSKSQKSLLRVGDRAHWRQRLQRQLQRDLENSQSILVKPNHVQLEGYSGRDFATGNVTARPTRVEYFIEKNSTGVLVRRETQLDALTNTNWKAEIVLVGVSALSVGDGTTALSSPNISKVAQPMPERVTLAISRPGGDLEFAHEFVLR